MYQQLVDDSRTLQTIVVSLADIQKSIIGMRTDMVGLGCQQQVNTHEIAAIKEGNR